MKTIDYFRKELQRTRHSDRNSPDIQEYQAIGQSRFNAYIQLADPVPAGYSNLVDSLELKERRKISNGVEILNWTVKFKVS